MSIFWEFPRYDTDGSEELSDKNSWRGLLPQTMEGADCFIPEAQIYPLENLVTLKLTGAEFTEMFSALYNGAEFTYPEKFLQIIANFLKGVHCPPILKPEECQFYPTYAAFLQYPLQNPYSQPTLVPDGYLTVPMVAVNAENQGDYSDFQINDIIVPINSFPLDTGWFDDVHEDFPSVIIHVQGSGTVEIKLLNVINGGMAIVTVDNPPNLVDIVGGTITGADNIIELNLDALSVPPETAQERIFEVDVTGEVGEMHAVYIVFFPIIDDSLIPLRFGGGFRGVELCGFQEEMDMGVTDVKWDDNEFMLMQQKMGVYYPVTDFQLFLDYIDSIEDSLYQMIILKADTEALDVVVADLGTIYDFTYNELEPRVAALENGQGAQNDLINEHEEAINALEIQVDALSDTLTGITGDIADLYGRLGEVWSQEFDFLVSEADWESVSTDWVSGEGWLMSNAFKTMAYLGSANQEDSRITFFELQIRRVSGSGFIDPNFSMPDVADNVQEINIPPTGVITTWMQINPVVSGSYTPQFKIDQILGLHEWRVEKLTIWGRGVNPFI